MKKILYITFMIVLLSSCNNSALLNKSSEEVNSNKGSSRTIVNVEKRNEKNYGQKWDLLSANLNYKTEVLFTVDNKDVWSVYFYGYELTSNGYVNALYVYTLIGDYTNWKIEFESAYPINGTARNEYLIYNLYANRYSFDSISLILADDTNTSSNVAYERSWEKTTSCEVRLSNVSSAAITGNVINNNIIGNIFYDGSVFESNIVLGMGSTKYTTTIVAPDYPINYVEAPTYSGIGGFDLNEGLDRIVTGDFNNDSRSDLISYRPGKGVYYVTFSNNSNLFQTVYAPAPGSGIAGFDLNDSRDRIKVGDFNNDQRSDVIMYRPGTGICYVGFSNGDGTFRTVYASASGIAGYDFQSNNDRLEVGDFNGDGKSDLLLYRPGTGLYYVAVSLGNGSFSTIYAPTPGSGIAGFDLKDSRDRIKVGDFNNDQKSDVIMYRPGTGICYVGFSNGNGTFSTVYASASGIAGYDLKSTSDRIETGDFTGDNKDDLLLYRPGKGMFYVTESLGSGYFSTIYAPEKNSGITGFTPVSGTGLEEAEFANHVDRVSIGDFNADMKKDVLFYRPGTGLCNIGISNHLNTFSLYYSSPVE